MRPAEYSTEAIIQAGQALLSTGRNITGFALRQKVGGGNPSRLKQVWDEYQAGPSMTNPDPVIEVPVEVSEEVIAVTKALADHIAGLARALNAKAVKAAELRVIDAVRGASEFREQANRELADAAQTVDGLEARLNEAKTETVELRNQLTEAQSTIMAQGAEMAQLRERLAAVEQAARTASEQHNSEIAQINRLREIELTHLQQEVDLLRVELSEHRQLSKAAVAAREEAAQLRGQKEAMHAQNADLMRILGERQSSGSKAAKSATRSPKEAPVVDNQAKLI